MNRNNRVGNREFRSGLKTCLGAGAEGDIGKRRRSENVDTDTKAVCWQEPQ